MLQDTPPTSPVTTLDEVIVTAARLPPAAGEAAFSVIRLGEETLAMVHAIERVCDGLLAALARRDPALLPVPAPAG